MWSFLARRLAGALVVLVVVSFAVFMLVKLFPGDPARAVAGETATPGQVRELRRKFHLDEPLFEQYTQWAGGAIHLDFGESYYGTSVSDQISARFPVTLGLVLTAAIIAALIGIPLGIASGVRPGRGLDRFGRFVSTLGVAIPSFVLAIVLVIFVAVDLHWLPPLGYVKFTTDPLEWLRYIFLPAFTLSLLIAAILARQLRASLVDVLDSNFVRAAWARGGTSSTVVTKHAMKNASIPAITVFGVQVGALLGGSVIVESIFSVPGLGPYFLTSIQQGDLPAIQAVTLVFVACQILIALLVDLTYGVLNPRIRVH